MVLEQQVVPSAANSTNGGTTSKVAWQWKANGGTTQVLTQTGKW